MAQGQFELPGIPSGRFATLSAPIVYEDLGGNEGDIVGSGGTGTEADPYTKVSIDTIDPNAPSIQAKAEYANTVAAKEAGAKDVKNLVFADITTEQWSFPITDVDETFEYCTKNNEKVFGSDILEVGRVLIRETDGYRHRIYMVKPSTGTESVGDFNLVLYDDRPYQ